MRPMSLPHAGQSLCRGAAIIAEVYVERLAYLMRTLIDSHRVVEMLAGEMPPRIFSES